jgi:hypothetical protein
MFDPFSVLSLPVPLDPSKTYSVTLVPHLLHFQPIALSIKLSVQSTGADLKRTIASLLATLDPTNRWGFGIGPHEEPAAAEVPLLSLVVASAYPHVLLDQDTVSFKVKFPASTDILVFNSTPEVATAVLLTGAVESVAAVAPHAAAVVGAGMVGTTVDTCAEMSNSAVPPMSPPLSSHDGVGDHWGVDTDDVMSPVESMPPPIAMPSKTAAGGGSMFSHLSCGSADPSTDNDSDNEIDRFLPKAPAYVAAETDAFDMGLGDMFGTDAADGSAAAAAGGGVAAAAAVVRPQTITLALTIGQPNSVNYRTPPSAAVAVGASATTSNVVPKYTFDGQVSPVTAAVQRHITVSCDASSSSLLQLVDDWVRR